MKKLTIHKTNYPEAPQPQIWLRDENYEPIAELGAWDDKKFQQNAAEIVAAEVLVLARVLAVVAGSVLSVVLATILRRLGGMRAAGTEQ